MAIVIYAHIDYTEEGVPFISGTQTKVVEVALDHLAYGWDAEDIHQQHPHLSLGQIHSSLAYYYDHKEEMDQDIDERLRRVEKIKARLRVSPVRHKLTDMGLLP